MDWDFLNLLFLKGNLRFFGAFCIWLMEQVKLVYQRPAAVKQHWVKLVLYWWSQFAENRVGREVRVVCVVRLVSGGHPHPPKQYLLTSLAAVNNKKSLSVFEWHEHFEKNYATRRFSAGVKKLHFLEFGIFFLKNAQLCRLVVSKLINSHRLKMVSMERWCPYLLFGT